MKELIKNLTSISETLSALSARMEKIAETIEMDAGQAKSAKRKAAPKATKRKAISKKKVAAKKKTAPKEAEPAAAGNESGSILDSIYGFISSGTEGTTVAEIKEMTGFRARQVNNALYKLKKQGKIDSISKGIYVKKES